MYRGRVFLNGLASLVILMFFLTSVGIVVGEPLDNGLYVSRSNVIVSQVDPSFWDDPEPLTIEPLKKRFDYPFIKPIIISQPAVYSRIIVSPARGASTWDYNTIISKSQELAVILVNNPYYQAGYSAFTLYDYEQVKVSGVKYGVTHRYYGRTDISSSWVTSFYNAAFSSDYKNVRILLEELQEEI